MMLTLVHALLFFSPASAQMPDMSQLQQMLNPGAAPAPGAAGASGAKSVSFGTNDSDACKKSLEYGAKGFPVKPPGPALTKDDLTQQALDQCVARTKVNCVAYENAVKAGKTKDVAWNEAMYNCGASVDELTNAFFRCVCDPHAAANAKALAPAKPAAAQAPAPTTPASTGAVPPPPGSVPPPPPGAGW
ncbi:MAG: hypothetical protein HY075_16680 [Deltaproteobacteria bacterium]|nr:hypothetical protein [Deltaproteobacteria bacterium]